jgi:DNA-binding GntR family transcriptional regulator
MEPRQSNLAPASAKVFGPLLQRALRQNLTQSLLTAIFRGQLREGEWLNAQKLAADFNVSATPVREALLELAAIGLVEMRHNRGTVVRPFSAQALRDIYHLREILEVEATRCACGRIPSAELEALRQAMTTLQRQRDPEWSDQAMSLDQSLHALIAQHCGSRRLAEEIGRYDGLMQGLRQAVGNQGAAQEQALPEHLEILQALSREDADPAAAAMRNHIQSTARIVAAALFPDPQTPPATQGSDTEGSHAD